MPALADVIRGYGRAYTERYGDRMPPSHRRALSDLAACRTAALGGQLTRCDRCAYEHYVYHSCRNRSCPTCHARQTAHWAAARRAELLPVPYYHVVFTLPKELRSLVRSHQRALLSALVTAAAHSLLKLAADPRHAGGTIGLLTVLHTWTRDLAYHPHVHCLVPGGALAPGGREWIPTRPSFLVPVRALSVLFRARFMASARAALPGVDFPQSVWKIPWVVYCKPTVQGATKVVDYLARYVHRIAIVNSRILSVEDGSVTFRYKDSESQSWKTLTLPATEFLRRFLQHVLPRGFHKVRYYGLLSPAYRQALLQLRLILDRGASAFSSGLPTVDLGSGGSEMPANRCPHCQLGFLIVILKIPRTTRSPP